MNSTRTPCRTPCESVNDDNSVAIWTPNRKRSHIGSALGIKPDPRQAQVGAGVGLDSDSVLLIFSALVNWISSRFLKISMMIADAYASGVLAVAG